MLRTKTGGRSISWRECAAYARRGQAVLPLLARAGARYPHGAIALSVHALRQAWSAVNQSDDTSDICELIMAIGAGFVEALRGAGVQTAAFGDTYLQLLLDAPVECFDTAAAQAAIGEAAVARYRTTLAQRWRAAKDQFLAAKAEHAAEVEKAGRLRRREPYRARGTERDLNLFALEQMYLTQLESAGEIDGVLAVLREDLSDAADHHRVTTFLEKRGRMSEALASAEHALNLFPDDARLQEDMLRCYEREGCVERVFALSRRRFDEAPSVERYRQVLNAAAAAGWEVDGVRAELQAALMAIESRASAGRRVLRLRGQQLASAGHRDVTLRVEVLCAEGHWTEALAVVQPPVYCSDSALEHLADGLAPLHQEHRVVLLKRVLAGAMLDAKRPYRREIGLVKKICTLLDSSSRAIWLDELRRDYGAKKDFIRDLPQG